MQKIIQEIILDNQRSKLYFGTTRDIDVSHLHGKASVVVGVRRAGKSTFLNQLIAKFVANGVSRENIMYINFFDDRLAFLKQGGLQLVSEAYYSLYPEKKSNETVYFFFDEIQVMPNWEGFVDRLLRTENCEVFISGSSANLLSKEIATQLRGRSLSWELFPFSFGEFLNHSKVHVGKHLDSKERLHVQKLFNHYWENGGFPEVATVEKKLRVRIHQEYFNSIIYRDIIERYDLSHPRGLKDLAAFLLDNISSLYSINNLTNYLQSLGHKIPKSSVSDYLLWLEDAYFLFTVRLFDASFKRSHANPKKIYCIDHSLVKSVSSGMMINSGHLLENLVFTALRRKLRDIFYYRTKDGKEVDFVVNSEEGHRLLIQVSESLRNQVTREREVRSLSNAMSELSVSKGYIVTRDEDELIEVDSSGVIQVIPIWKFLLDF